MLAVSNPRERYDTLRNHPDHSLRASVTIWRDETRPLTWRNLPPAETSCQNIDALVALHVTAGRVPT